MIESEGRILSVNTSDRQGVSKQPVPEATIGPLGLEGDAHAGPWHRQTSLLAVESIERFSAQSGRTFRPGEFAENLTTQGLDLGQAGLLDRIVVEPSGGGHFINLEVTQIGKQCHPDGCAIFRDVGRCVMPREGVFCRVFECGRVKPGDIVRLIPRVLRIRILTLSDRASQGLYDDRGGPRVRECLDEFFSDKRWHVEIAADTLPDDASRLRQALEAARGGEADVVFTTGGTGIGPRDITPDVILDIADRIIPGIMEHIRLKFGAEKPNALLSRSVAAVMNRTLVYALPGSVHAVSEYMGEILKSLEHALLMTHGLDAH